MKRSRNVDLPEELIHEILLRLPVRALLRSKCVCKEWCALIGSPSFINRHFDNKSNRDCLLFQRVLDDEGKLEFFMYPEDGEHLRLDMPSGIIHSTLLGPANGLFCVVNQKLRRVALFNPATRKFKLLPPIPLLKPRYLVFGFGFDPFSGDYKVVAFEVKMESRNSFCVYNSSSDSWSKTDVVDPLNKRMYLLVSDCPDFSSKIVVNGVYHWLMEKISILGFDMRSETFQEIPLPDAEFSPDMNITAYGDSIALLSSVKHCVELWVMGQDGLWSKSFSVAIVLPQPDKWPRLVWSKNVCVWKKKNELLLEIVRDIDPGKTQTQCSFLYVCDISTQKVQTCETGFGNLTVSGVLSYKESLFSIEGERGIPHFFQDIFQLGDRLKIE